jgi:hypothetical protein
MKTGRIRFNVTERLRRYRGQNRNFDTKVLSDLVNGPELQERVKNRDLHGYLGHWPRRVFGIEPGEGGIHQGKHVPLEPAIVTTHLHAAMDGTLEHETEFLDTATGRLAKRMFESKVGGFSSAISCRELAGRDIPVGFHGFDYVNEPNFNANRGYTLDGVEEDSPELVFDSALTESAQTLKILDGMYSSLQGNYDQLAQALARVTAERDELLGIAARAGVPDASLKSRMANLDRGGFRLDAVGSRPLPSSTLLQMAAEFADMKLPERAAPPQTKEERMVRGIVAQASSLIRGR